MGEKIKDNVVFLIVSLVLVFALADLEYGYYQLLRWFTCGVAVYGIMQNNLQSSKLWMWIFVAIAIMFNPIFPVHFHRQTWSFIDVISAIILLVYFTHRVLGKKKGG